MQDKAERGMKYSIKTQMVAAAVAAVAVFFAAFFLANNFLLPRFYQKHKMNDMIDLYQELSALEKNGTIAEIDRAENERFIHRKNEVAVAANALLVSNCFLDCSAKHDRTVLDSVMSINFQISLSINCHVKQTMTRKCMKHMIKEANSRRNICLASAINIQGYCDISLTSLPGNCGASLRFSGVFLSSSGHYPAPSFSNRFTFHGESHLLPHRYFLRICSSLLMPSLTLREASLLPQ